MKKFKILFEGKKKGSIGIRHMFKEEVEAESKAIARQSLYKNYEHITVLRITDDKGRRV